MPTTTTRAGRPLGSPMLCKALDVVPDDEQFLMSIKYDGWRAIAHITEGGVEFRTRAGNLITAVPYLETVARTVGPAGTILDGEIVDLASARQFDRTQTILERHEAHTPTAQSPELTYVVFDALFADGLDLRQKPLCDRLAVLHSMFLAAFGLERHAALTDDGEPVIVEASHVPASSMAAQLIVEQGYEGVVIKHRDSLYRHGARNAGWWKFKPAADTEAECTGFFPGQGQYAGAGWIGGMTFRLPSGKEGRVGTGLSEPERRHMAAHPELYIGRVIELAHHGTASKGGLRNPVYLRTRSPQDKSVPTPSAATSRTATRKVPTDKALATAVAGSGGRRRNYEAMGDAKLKRCIRELEAGEGDAYDRCLERGSEDPAGDLEVALAEANKRGLSE
jgi:ATP-dependent DNA ligase